MLFITFRIIADPDKEVGNSDRNEHNKLGWSSTCSKFFVSLLNFIFLIHRLVLRFIITHDSAGSAYSSFNLFLFKF